MHAARATAPLRKVSRGTRRDSFRPPPIASQPRRISKNRLTKSYILSQRAPRAPEQRAPPTDAAGKNSRAAARRGSLSRSRRGRAQPIARLDARTPARRVGRTRTRRARAKKRRENTQARARTAFARAAQCGKPSPKSIRSAPNNPARVCSEEQANLLGRRPLSWGQGRLGGAGSWDGAKTVWG